MGDFDRLQALYAANPQEAMKLLARLKERQVVPHSGQRPVIDSDARFKVLNAGRRWGKTKIGAKEIIRQSRCGDNRLTWWVAPTYKVVKRGYREVLRQLPPDYLTHDPPPDTNFDAGRSVILRFKNGSQMEFYSAERPGGMLGEGVNFAILDEAATMPGNVWEQIVRPTLADKLGGAMLISTPRGRNWFYQRHQRGQDPESEAWASWTFPSWTNPYLAAEEIEEMRSELPRLIFEQEVEAKFLASGSSVFMFGDEAVQNSMVLDSGFVAGIKPEGHVVLGIDLAKTHDWTVIYGARASDRRNCYFERLNSVSWAEQKRRIRRAVRALYRNGATGVTLVMDSTGVGDPIVEDMEEQGYDVVPINFTTHKTNMVKLLSKDLEMGRAFILEEAQKHEFENYAMKITPGGKFSYSAPEGEHDDAVSAKMLQHHGLVNEGVPGVTTLAADDAFDTPEPFEADPEDDEYGIEDNDGWDDLIDPEDWLDEEAWDVPEAVVPIGRALTPEEIFANPEAWSSANTRSQ